MKTIHRLLLAICVCGGIAACAPRDNKDGWKLTWEDTFEHTTFDTAVWSKIPRGGADWNRHMSSHPDCYAVDDGQLVLRGIMNPDPTQDTARYITGGLYTKNKKSFYGGRLEIKAKLQGAQGAWPAIWLMPSEGDKYPWPSGGEIDIMERLNFDTIAYQTVHSAYTYYLRQTTNPPQGSTGSIRPDDYNVYAVEMYPDSLVFFINNRRTFAYPRIETDKEGQFPFDKPYYLKIDMQLGGSWVGKVDTLHLPVEMRVDWVRYYTKQN